MAVPCVGDMGLTSGVWEGGVFFSAASRAGGEGGNFLISSSRFAAGPEPGVCGVGGGREPVLESGSPVTGTYFQLVLTLCWPGLFLLSMETVGTTCFEAPLGKRLWAVNQPVGCQSQALCCRWALQGRGTAGHEGLGQSGAKSPRMCRAVQWLRVCQHTGGGRCVLAPGWRGDQKELLGCLG